MAVTAAQAIKRVVTQLRPMIADEKVADVGATQAGAARITGAFTRVTKSGGTAGSLVLPRMIENEAGAGMYIVSNETGDTIKVYCALGDTLNNSANAALTIADGGFGVFVKEHAADYAYVAPDWAAAAFT